MLSATDYSVYSQVPSISGGRFSIRNPSTHLVQLLVLQVTVCPTELMLTDISNRKLFRNVANVLRSASRVRVSVGHEVVWYVSFIIYCDGIGQDRLG